MAARKKKVKNDDDETIKVHLNNRSES